MASQQDSDHPRLGESAIQGDGLLNLAFGLNFGDIAHQSGGFLVLFSVLSKHETPFMECVCWLVSKYQRELTGFHPMCSISSFSDGGLLDA